ncbi:MAG: AlkZ family DNA glycosylase [Spirochaetes bacterium]|nr:AlkZ family DNA glycosylase [Spirochaetota bacterium]
MKSDSIAAHRITSQHIGAGKFQKAGDVVAHMGAMQAQDFAMARWAVGLRSAALTEKDILNAYNKGEILRTHVLRPTWHLVANSDADWLLRLSAPQLLGSLVTWNKKLKLSESVYARSQKVLEKALLHGPVTRDTAVAALKAAKPGFPPGSHTLFLFRAEIDRLIVSGPLIGGETTYTLFDARVKKREDLPREEAAARLAQRYFTSHGPATLEDFIWWSGLKTSEARQAFAAVANNFCTETFKGLTYLMPQKLLPASAKTCLLPGFDEFIIGYTDRSAMLGKDIAARVISRNGIFRPTIVQNGRVRGIWAWEVLKGKRVFKPTYFDTKDIRLAQAAATELKRLATFYGAPLGS